MTPEEIITYVNNTPENTNPNVLRSMLGQLQTGGYNFPSGGEIGQYLKKIGATDQDIAWADVEAVKTVTELP